MELDEQMANQADNHGIAISTTVADAPAPQNGAAVDQHRPSRRLPTEPLRRSRRLPRLESTRNSSRPTCTSIASSRG